MFCDDFAPCKEVAKNLLQKTSCMTLLPLSRVESTLTTLDGSDIDLVIFVSRIIQPGKITDPQEAKVSSAQQFTEAIGDGKRVIYLSGHHLYLVDDSQKQQEEIAREIEAFSHSLAWNHSYHYLCLADFRRVFFIPATMFVRCHIPQERIG